MSDLTPEAAARKLVEALRSIGLDADATARVRLLDWADGQAGATLRREILASDDGRDLFAGLVRRIRASKDRLRNATGADGTDAGTLLKVDAAWIDWLQAEMDSQTRLCTGYPAGDPNGEPQLA